MNDERRLRFGLGVAALLIVAGVLYGLKPDPVAPVLAGPIEPARPAPAEPAPATPMPAPDSNREQPARPPPPPAPRAEEPKPPDLPTDPRERLKALEPLRREVFAGLADLGGRVEACGLRNATIILTLETMERRVRVLEVRVGPAGAGTSGSGEAEQPAPDDRAASCVRGALERTIFSAPSARPGRQWEMPWGPGMTP